MSCAIEIKNLEKHYQSDDNKSVHALKNVSLDIPKGSVFGLLGPNGAGKSTLINIIAGNVIKSSGQVKVGSFDIDTDLRQAKLAVGVVSQELSFDPYFTPERTLNIQAGLYGVPKQDRKTAELLKFVDLGKKAKSYSRSLSGGMKRRLMVAKAMVHQPDILILDEPTAGVDVELRKTLWKNVRELNARGVTIVLTTHYLEEAEEMCDHIAIINHGEIVANDRKEKLLQHLNQNCVQILFDQKPVKSLFSKITPHIKIEGKLLCLKYVTGQNHLDQILKTAIKAGYKIEDVSSFKAGLEDVFLSIVSQKKS